MFEHPDDADFHYSTAAEWDREAAREIGAANPNQAWIVTDRDVIYANPFYQGPPVRHPDDYENDFEGQGGAEPPDLPEIPF